PKRMKSTETPSTARPAAAQAGADSVSALTPTTILCADCSVPPRARRRLEHPPGAFLLRVVSCYIASEPPFSARPRNPTGVRMRLSLRFILPLAITLAAIAYAVIPLVDKFTLQWFVRDLDLRTSLIANTIQDPLHDLVREGSRTKVLRFFDQIMRDERLFAVAYCDPSRRMIYKTAAFPASITCAGDDALVSESHLVNLQRGPIHVAIHRVESEGTAYGYLILG